MATTHGRMQLPLPIFQYKLLDSILTIIEWTEEPDKLRGGTITLRPQGDYSVLQYLPWQQVWSDPE